jgi:hypothetical protein
MFRASLVQLWLFTCLCLSFALAGCGSGNPSVEGTVTYNGEPVDGGGISFVSPGKGPTVGTEIVGGKYSIPSNRGLLPGPHRVVINWKKKTGKSIPVPGDNSIKMDETKEVLPKKYNTSTTLEIPIAAGRNTHDFKLEK